MIILPHPAPASRSALAVSAGLLYGLLFGLVACSDKPDGGSSVVHGGGGSRSTPPAELDGGGAAGGNSAQSSSAKDLAGSSPRPGLSENEILAKAYAEAASHLERDPNLSLLEASLTAIPSELAPTLDPSLIEPGDPEDFPAASHIGGVPVRILRERHPTSNVLLRIATVRATEADTESMDGTDSTDGTEAAAGADARPILHGPEWLYHDSGALRSTLWWNQDVKHGPIKQWRPVGTCIFEGRFKDGQRDGLRKEYSKAGKLLEVLVYDEGNRHGPFRAWFPKGDEREVAYFVSGRYEGPRKVWGRGGLLVLSENYKKGLRDGRWSDFDPASGTPRTWGTFSKGKRVGVWQTGSPEGGLLESYEYADGVMDGEAKIWAPTGELIERAHYKAGRQTGPSTTWYTSGVTQSEGELVDGARTGPWTYWRKDGSVNDTWSGVYDNDLRIGPLETAPAPAEQPDDKPGGKSAGNPEGNPEGK